MAAKFTKGDSIASTRTTRSQHHPDEPKTHSVDGPRRGNTMNGMPGYINAHQKEDLGGAKGGKGFGPHREGSIGERGSSGARSLAKASQAPGMSTKNYKSASTGRAGTIKGNANTGASKVHTRSRGMAGQKAPPTAVGKIGGGHERAAGIDLAHAKQSRGKMESMTGRARTSSEGRRKSLMY